MKSTIICLLVLTFPVLLFSQRSIKGSVYDEYNEALPGVSIIAKGYTIGTLTDGEGNYSLEIPEEAQFLVFRYIGFAEREIEIGKQKEIDVTLRDQSYFLEQVVITGVATGTSTTKVGFNIAKVNDEQLKEVPGVNAATALQGKVAGVNVLSSGGVPGRTANIRIRGLNNIQGFAENPLIIVDGIQLQNPGNLSDINSEDIESMEVIKGAAATSLYGSRAANGVVNIITKRGSDQIGRTTITLRNEFGKNSLQRRIPINLHHHYAFNPDGTINYAQVDDDGIADNEYAQIFNHQDIIFDPGQFMTNTLAIGSRTKTTNYYISLQNTQQTGVMTTLKGYRRQSIRANIDHKITDALEINFSNNYVQSTQDDPPLERVGFTDLLLLPPPTDLFTPNEEDGSPYNWDEPQKYNSQVWNPLFDLSRIDRQQKTERFISSLGFKLKILSPLTLEGSYAIDKRDVSIEQFLDKGYLGWNPWADGEYFRSNSKNSYQTTTGKLTFQKAIGRDIKFLTQAAFIYEDVESKFFSTRVNDFQFQGLRSLSNAGTTSDGVNRTNSSSFDLEVKTMNYYLTANVDWKDKLILDGLVRFDGSSLFGEGNRWNTFFRSSIAYRLSQDITIPQVQELKFRVSYGTAGNRPSFNYRFETLSSEGRKITLGNRNLSSAFQSEIEAGIDATLFNRISLSITFARSYSTDLFYNVPLPVTAGGFRSQWQNIDAERQSTAFEASLGVEIIQAKDWELSANLTFDRVTSFINKFDFPDLIDFIYLIRENEVPGTFWIRKFARSEADLFPYQRAGKSFVVNHEGWLVEESKLGTKDERPILVEDEEGNQFFKGGHALPDFNMGFTLNARWKGLRVYTLLHWKQGGDLVNHTKQSMYRDLRHGDIDQSGRPDELKKTVEYYSAFYNSGRISNYFIEDGSYLKIRELAVSYTFQTQQWGSFGDVVRNMKLAVIGRNLFTFTKYTGYDPEVGWLNPQFDPSVGGFDSLTYPNFRTVSGSLEINF